VKKYIFFLFLIVIIFFAMVNSKPPTKHFENKGISFDYPKNWNEVANNGITGIASFKVPETSLRIDVNKVTLPQDYSLRNHFSNSKINDNSDPNFKLISKRVNEINSIKGYEFVYQINKNSVSTQRKEFWFEKNGSLYSIIYTDSVGTIVKPNFSLYNLNIQSSIFDLESKKALNTVINSLNVSNSKIDYNNPFWADLDIPSIGANFGIRSDTVNAYDSVYHYSKSVYPGENGKSGLMGHHTHYSAPFMNINLLKKGDKIIINDFLTLKKYIYTVNYNGDIKWDYKVNPIQFEHNGGKKLILVTCYPPGFMKGAWIVHSKLTSIQPL
jgi:sortase A